MSSFAARPKSCATRLAGAISTQPRALTASSPGERTEAVTLSAAQLVVARELGFASWPQLKLAVDRRQLDRHESVSTFVDASLDGREQLAAALLREDPSIGRADIFAAAVLGDAEFGA